MDDLNVTGALQVTLEAQEQEPPADPDPDADAAKDAQEGRVAVATTLATGVTVLAAALGLFGGLTGAVARMARNFPGWTAIAVLAVVVSVALAVVARGVAPGRGDKKALRHVLADHRQPYWSTALLWTSGALFVFGIGTAVVLITLTIDKDDRPSVSAQSTRDAETGVVSLAGTAKASGLAADDALRVVVVAFAKGETDEGTQVYYAVVGSNADGVVDHTFTLILPQDARSVVVTAGNDAEDTSGAPKACEPDSSVDKPVDPANPVSVSSSGASEGLTACALVSVPEPPPVATGQTKDDKKDDKKDGKKDGQKDGQKDGT